MADNKVSTLFWVGLGGGNVRRGEFEIDRMEKEREIEGGIYATSLEWRFIRPHQRRSVRSVLITDNLLHNQHI